MPAATEPQPTPGLAGPGPRRGRRRQGEALELAFDAQLTEIEEPAESWDEPMADGPDEATAEPAHAPVTWSGGWRERSKRSVAGAMFSGMAMALREIFEPDPSDESVLVVDAGGEPVDLPVKVYLDPDTPAGSRCVVDGRAAPLAAGAPGTSQ